LLFRQCSSFFSSTLSAVAEKDRTRSDAIGTEEDSVFL
jgi:hypothetical protein